MIAELGQLLLSFSLVVCVFYGCRGLFLVTSTSQNINVLSVRKSLSQTAVLVNVLILITFILLMNLFAVSDFSVLLVAQNSNALLPLPYKLAATWGSHEGSFLLWVLMLSAWTCAVAIFSKPLDNRFQIRVVSILLLLQGIFLLYLLLTSNPFGRIFPAPIAGRDLNPLLQDPFMIIHPPMLYMGYVGFSVCFALAVAALLEGKINSTWAKWCRPWANAAWAFLTLGILLGSWWAYRELGWGGWWFWDPVENASLMPWFAGTALMHSLAVTDKRNALKSWTVLLSITAFAFSLLGTFLVRSGVLTSVHSFASDPTRGVFILIMLTLIVGSAFILYGIKTKKLGMGETFSPISRESLLLVNNIIMAGALAAVMLGTLYPLIAEVITGRKMSVGPPYFNSVISPILLPAVFFMSIAPRIIWKDAHLLPAIKTLFVPILVSVVVAVFFMLYKSNTSISASLGLMGALILFISTLYSAFQRLQILKKHAIENQDAKSALITTRIKKLGAAYWGMIIAHSGVAIFTAGVVFVMTYQIEKDIVMKPNQIQSIGDHNLKFIGVRPISGSNYSGVEGLFELAKENSKEIHLLMPQKRKYLRSDDPMTEASILYGFFGDFYVSLGEPTTTSTKDSSSLEASWTIRASFKPMMAWVWVGCFLMALGGGLAIFDKRYLKQKKSDLSSKTVPEPNAINSEKLVPDISQTKPLN
ncbi:MAG: heme lyase NrfEFG subunit NrfE [Betaproteobacteria bacterium TMED100]|nr:MAG: heme lyase NrfEFG subunit NrfE [Betaproteobacteria bacterium TMED100]